MDFLCDVILIFPGGIIYSMFFNGFIEKLQDESPHCHLVKRERMEFPLPRGISFLHTYGGDNSPFGKKEKKR